MTVKVNCVPAVTLEGTVKANLLKGPATTGMLGEPVVIDPSVAVIVQFPTVFSVPEKLPTPPVKTKLPLGIVPMGSLVLKVMGPVYPVTVALLESFAVTVKLNAVPEVALTGKPEKLKCVAVGVPETVTEFDEFVMVPSVATIV